MSILLAGAHLILALNLSCQSTVSSETSVSFFQYEAERDAGDIEAHFKADLKWLTNNPLLDVNHLIRSRPEGAQETTVLRTSEGELLGFITYGTKSSRTQGHVRLVLVAKNHRGKNWGKRLMQYAEHRLRKKGCDEIDLYTKVSNIGARRFFEGLGYRGLPMHRPDFVTMKKVFSTSKVGV
tara:strand:- start:367 stop:909 length:543 start_codon:yes stop_codon:yes gene_type:complete